MRAPTHLALALTLAASRASAQDTPDEIARRELIAAAEQARDAGDHARALDLATRASELRMTPSLRQMIAYEHDALGHVIDAFDAAGRCVREAEIDPAVRNREVILTACRALVDSLRARVGRVVVRAPDPSPAGLRVTVGGVVVPPALWGVAYPVAPGAVTVDAVSVEGATFHRSLTVQGGDAVEVRVTLTAPPPRRVARGVGAGPVVLWSVGGAALVAGGVLVAFGAVARSDRDAECDASGHGRCDPVAQRLDDQYRALTVAGGVALGVGAASLVGGMLWRLLPPVFARRDDLRVVVSPSSQGVAVVVGGSL